MLSREWRADSKAYLSVCFELSTTIIVARAYIIVKFVIIQSGRVRCLRYWTK